jgi:hypothetical protein
MYPTLGISVSNPKLTLPAQLLANLMLNFIYQNKQINSSYTSTRPVKLHTSVKIGNLGEFMNCKWRCFILALGNDGTPL